VLLPVSCLAPLAIWISYWLMCIWPMNSGQLQAEVWPVQYYSTPHPAPFFIVDDIAFSRDSSSHFRIVCWQSSWMFLMQWWLYSYVPIYWCGILFAHICESGNFCFHINKRCALLMSALDWVTLHEIPSVYSWWIKVPVASWKVSIRQAQCMRLLCGTKKKGYKSNVKYDWQVSNENIG
jgi:hypothetical protein